MKSQSFDCPASHSVDLKRALLKKSPLWCHKWHKTFQNSHHQKTNPSKVFALPSWFNWTPLFLSSCEQVAATSSLRTGRFWQEDRRAPPSGDRGKTGFLHISWIESTAWCFHRYILYLIEIVDVNQSVSEVLTAALLLLHWALLAGSPGTVAQWNLIRQQNVNTNNMQKKLELYTWKTFFLSHDPQPCYRTQTRALQPVWYCTHKPAKLVCCLLLFWQFGQIQEWMYP